MTISSETRKAGPYIGTGATTSFPFAFKVFAAADLYVVRTDTTLGTDTVLALGTDYTVSLNGDQNANPGGNVVLPAALATGYNLTITSSLQYLQPTDLTNQGGFYPSVITNALDRLTILCQQLFERVSRSLSLPVSAPSGTSTTLPLPSSNNLIGWNTAGDGLQNFDPTTLATIVAFGTANADQFTGTGSQTQFALSANPGALNNLDVSVGGVTQTPGVDYTWASGTTITFTTAPALGVKILARYMQALPQGYTTADLVQYTPGGTGAVPADLQTVLRRWVSVKDFGAKGDGVTNDTDAFNLAIKNSLSIYIPAGTYILGPTATWAGTLLYLGTNTGNASRNGICIMGAGQGNTVLKLANSAGTNVLLFGTGTTDTLNDATFSDMTIDLNGANNNTNSIYNSAFYLYSATKNITIERITFKNMAGQQTVRVGGESLTRYGDGVTVRHCLFDTFGIGGGFSTTDISVLFIQAENYQIYGNTFRNPTFALSTGTGHTAIEVNGATAGLVYGNSFTYVQLGVLIDSFYQTHSGVSIHGNTFSQCNFMVSMDTGSTFDQKNIKIHSNNWKSTWNNSSSIISLGAVAEASKVRDGIDIYDNIIDGTGNTNQGLHVCYAPSIYLRGLTMRGNKVTAYNGSLLRLEGTVQNTGLLDIVIDDNELDSLGQSSGGPAMIDVEHSVGTINSLTITNNKLRNRDGKSYATKGAIYLSGTITNLTVKGNTGAGGVGTTYPLALESSLTTTNKAVDTSTVSGFSELPVDYRPNTVAVTAGASVNLFDFSSFTLNNFAMLEIDAWVSVGGSANGSLVSYKVLVGSSAKVATLVTQGGTYGAQITLNFSGNVLRVTSSAGVTLALMFRIKGMTTLPIAWLV